MGVMLFGQKTDQTYSNLKTKYHVLQQAKNLKRNTKRHGILVLVRASDEDQRSDRKLAI